MSQAEQDIEMKVDVHDGVVITSLPSPHSVSHRHASNSSQASIAESDQDVPSLDGRRRTLKSKLTPPSTPKIKVEVGQALEIDQSTADNDEGTAPHDDAEDDLDSDLELLLGELSDDAGLAAANSRTATHARSLCGTCSCSRGQPRAGNTLVIFPSLYARTKWGIVGPHYFGPVFVLLILVVASLHFIGEAMDIGPFTTAVCVVFTVLTAFNLVSVAFRDPGIVTTRSHPPESIKNLSQWRWCDLCDVYQPPDGQHCPDCNVCVEGYDHHCVWMGTCIGKGNMRQFIQFNLSWLLYLIYSIAWVTVLGPRMYRGEH